MQREDEFPAAEIISGAAGDAPLATVPDPATLIRGFRLLAERIPGFIHLTKDEVRSMIRASELDPEMIAAGIVVTEVWDDASIWVQMTPEELRELDTTIAEVEAVIEQTKILLDGMIGANRVRKHRRGKAILDLYKGLEIAVRSSAANNHLRPYFENMRRAYMKNRKRRKAKGEAGEPAE